MNLTTVEPGPEMVIRHYCESLFFARASAGRHASFDRGYWQRARVFQAIPLAILKPNGRVTLGGIESTEGRFPPRSNTERSEMFRFLRSGPKTCHGTSIGWSREP